MLHTNFRENRPPGLEKKIFEVFFTIYGRGRHLGHVTQMPRTNFRSPYPRDSTLNLALIGQAVLEKIFEHCGRGWTDTGP